MLQPVPPYARQRRPFGRRAEQFTQPNSSVGANSLHDDLRLFGMTFAAGFIVVSVLIA